MKNTLKALAVILFGTCMTFALAACGGNEESGGPGPHQHQYSEQWSSDATHHWHDPTCNDTTEPADKDTHTWSDGECSVCHRPDETEPTLTVTGLEETYTVDAGAELTLPAATAADPEEGNVEVEYEVTPNGYTIREEENGSYVFSAQTSGEYTFTYFAQDAAGNFAEKSTKITVDPPVAETQLQDGENLLENLDVSETPFKENFGKGYGSPLAKGFNEGNLEYSIKATDQSIAGNSLFLDYSQCRYDTDTKTFFGGVITDAKSGRWKIEMDVKVLTSEGAALPGNQVYFNILKQGQTNGIIEKPMGGILSDGQVHHLSFNEILTFDEGTWFFCFATFTGDSSYQYKDLVLVIDNIEFTWKQTENAVVETRTTDPTPIVATDLDGAGHTFTGADENYTGLNNMKYLYKDKLVTGDYLTAEQAENITAANGFNSNYVILASTQVCTFSAIDGLCTDPLYEYTITIKVYAPAAQDWYFFLVNGSGGQAGAEGLSIPAGASTKSYTFVGSDSYQKVGLYTGNAYQLFIGDVTISRAEREDTSKTAHGHSVGDSWTKNAEDLNGWDDSSRTYSTLVTCSEQDVTGGKLSTVCPSFGEKAMHISMENDKSAGMFRAGDTLENGCTYKITFEIYVVEIVGKVMINVDNSAFFDVSGVVEAGYHKIEITHKMEKDADFVSLYVQSGCKADVYISSITYELTALA